MYSDIGLLILRLVLGIVFAAHGAQKLFGAFGGGGLKGTTDWMVGMGLRPAWFWALVAGISEFGGGVLLALGFLSPLGALGIVAAMLVAIVKVHWQKGFWNTKGGFEYPLIILAAALALALLGPGAFSLDAALGISLPEPITLVAGLVAVIVGLLAALASQAPQPARVSHSAHR
jgi:putative oxidoreductase